ncbi:MAG TPA: outer membrane protein assembly factor BamD [Planctomycetaceae bacterium]|nr:outer membrane protein assembly factor BamD [Planctomycetaceae bacterium]
MLAYVRKALLLCLCGLLAGCRNGPPGGTPPSLPPGYSQRYSEEDEYSGWLFRRLARGPDRAASQRPAAVQQVSAEEVSQGPSDSPSEEPASDGFQLSDLAPEKLWEQVKEATGMAPHKGVAEALFGEGEELYRQKRYAEAAERFKKAAARWPDSELAENALLMAAESYFFSDQYPEAFDTYSQLLAKYKHTEYLDRVSARIFAIGRYWDQLHAVDPGGPLTIDPFDHTRPWIDPMGHALKAYEAVRMNDPTGPLADDSLMATANAMFTRGRYSEAADYYQMLRQHYPKSEHLLEACLLEMKSRLEMYQGPMYDGTPLVEASELADQLLAQFPGQLSPEHRELVIRTKNRIVEQMAERDWAMAQYYENRKLYGAARFYYEALIKDYPQTAVAQRARQRLGQIRDLPAEPPDHFRWLTSLFDAQTEP